MNAFQLDCGRMYFTKEQILAFAKTMAEAGRDTLILAFGNEGFRFLLDDMSISAGGKTYASDAVKAAICAGNKAYRDCSAVSGANELTQSEMLELFEFCKKNNLQIIPLFNTPGHMSAILTAMEKLGIEKVRYENSRTTIDLSNTPAVEFLKALIQKYVSWFGTQGCRYFHLGCDEYANDVLHNGFKSLQNPENYGYDSFVNYVNSLAKITKVYGLVPVMFNDGMYYENAKPQEIFNPEIVCAYWSKGWPGYELAPAGKIAQKGHKILNTHNGWYYVLGRHNGKPGNQDFTIEKSLEGAKNISSIQLASGEKGKIVAAGESDLCRSENEAFGEKIKIYGTVVCLWCDEPCVLTEEELECVKRVIKGK